MKNLIVAVLMFGSATTESATDDGKVDRYYVNENGNVGITLVGGFPNAAIENNCGTNKKIGLNKTNNEHIVSALLAAKAAEKTISVTTNGCITANWPRIIAVEIID